MTMHQRRGRHSRPYRLSLRLRSTGRHAVWAARAISRRQRGDGLPF